MQITQSTVEETIYRLEAEIAGFEKQYHCSTREMLAKLHSGQCTDNWDICVWMADVRAIVRLKALSTSQR